MKSERIYLRGIHLDDLTLLREKRNSRDLQLLIGSVYPESEQKIESLYQKASDHNDRIWFLIVDKQSEEAIGETGFHRFFPPWRTSDFSLFIWEEENRGKGYGEEAAKLMFEYGFDSLNFHRLSIGVLGNNNSALRFWEKIGFLTEGKQIEGYYSNGKYSDFIMMYLLEDRYRELSAKRELSTKKVKPDE